MGCQVTAGSANMPGKPPQDPREAGPGANAETSARVNSDVEDLAGPPQPGPALGDMPVEDFRRFGHEIIDWIADYWEHPERYPVSPDVEPGALVDALPCSGPESGETMERILADFEKQVLPHVTHWNHPGFMAYFATTGSAPGVLGDLLASALNPIGLLWKTCPALVELEQVTLRWLAEWMGLPKDWFAMTLGGASTGTIHAVIAAREAALAADRAKGRGGDPSRLTLYTSAHAHSSVEKASLALGLNREHCRKIAVDEAYRMRPESLEQAVDEDLAAGLRPFCVVATVGTTSTSSIDPVPAVADVCERHALWLHVDAAYAGSAAIVPEKRHILDGCERADSFLFNPHKWLFVPMELTAFYTRRPEDLRAALSLVPEYLRSQENPRAVNFMEYALPLGRRFRGLKLWFVLRHFGRDGLVANLREHMRLAQHFAAQVDEHRDFVLMAPVPFSLVCFRYKFRDIPDSELDSLNQQLLDDVNRTGEFFLSHTTLDGRLTLRVAIGNIRTTQAHVDRLWEVLIDTAECLSRESSARA